MPANPKDESAARLKQSLCRILACTVGVAAVYCAAVAVLLGANRLHQRSINPVNHEALSALKTAISRNPDDDEIKDVFRRLDTSVRSEFYRTREFGSRGAWMLGVGMVVLAGAAVGLASLTKTPYYPGKAARPASEDDRLLRRGLLSGALTLAALTFIVGLDLGRVALPGEDGDPGDGKAAEEPGFEEFRANWPSFRGCGATGVASHGDAPLVWDGGTGEGILWKAETPKVGFSSPVVWGDRLFVTGADDESRDIYAYNADTGQLLWQLSATDILGSPATLPDVSDDTGFAASTPTVDGKRVYAVFATGDVLCSDLDGKRLWARNIGVPDNPYGHASSLVVHKGRLLIQFDHFKGARFLALDVTNGNTLWENTREVGASWATPLLVNTGSRVEAILNAEPFVMAYDAETGAELWRAEVMGGEVGPSPAFAGGLAFATTDYAVLVGLRTGDGEGAGTVAWEVEDDLPDVSSPVGTGSLLFVASGAGIVTCYEAETGEVLWKHEYPDGFYSSPIVVGDRVYLTDRKGITHIFRAGREFEALGESPLGEPAMGTFAVMPGRLYTRGMRHLFCIGAK